MDLLAGDIAHPVGNLFEAGDLEALAGLDGLDKGRGLQQGVVGAGVEPGVAAAHGLDVELVAREVSLVDVGNLELTAIVSGYSRILDPPAKIIPLVIM